MDSTKNLQTADLRFEFGKNWSRFLQAINEEKIIAAERALVEMLQVENLDGKSFLDIGSGNGWGTAAIWNYHLKKKLFFPKCKTQIFGIEPDNGLLRIAKEEFPEMIKKHNGTSYEIIENFADYFPKFSWGTITDIPFEDNSLDYVYVSQVLLEPIPQ